MWGQMYGVGREKPVSPAYQLTGVIVLAYGHAEL